MGEEYGLAGSLCVNQVDVGRKRDRKVADVPPDKRYLVTVRGPHRGVAVHEWRGFASIHIYYHYFAGLPTGCDIARILERKPYQREPSAVRRP